MPPRDELLLIVCITAGVIRAGVGVHDLIRAPLVVRYHSQPPVLLLTPRPQELSTRIGRRPAVAPYKITDYLVGQPLMVAEAAGEELEVIHPMIVSRYGLEVVDWTGVEAILSVPPLLFPPSRADNTTNRRYIFHIALAIPRPPLAHPVLLSLPPHLPPLLVDQFHALLFERLLVPQLLVSSRPFFAAASAGVLSSVVLDIGARGEGSEVSVVHESQLVESATMRVGVDEGCLDDWVALQMIKEDPGLVVKIGQGAELGKEHLVAALRTMIASLKAGDTIAFSSPLMTLPLVPVRVVGEDDEGNFDVAKVLVEGKVDKIVGRKDKKGKKAAASGEDEDEGDFVEVPHPLDAEAEAIRVGPARHRYLEPLFFPSILAELAPSASPEAAVLGLEEYEGREVVHFGVQEVMGIVVEQVEDVEVRKFVWDGVVIVSSGKVANIPGTLLSPSFYAGQTLTPSLRSPRCCPRSPPLAFRYRRRVGLRNSAQDAAIREGAGLLFRIQGTGRRAGMLPRRLHHGQGTLFRGPRSLAAGLKRLGSSQLLISDTQSKLFMVRQPSSRPPGFLLTPSSSQSKSDYSTKGPAYYRLLDAL